MGAEVEANDVAMLIDNFFTHVCFQLAVTGAAQERWTGIWRPEELRRLAVNDFATEKQLGFGLEFV